MRDNQSGSSTSALEWLGSLDPFSRLWFLEASRIDKGIPPSRRCAEHPAREGTPLSHAKTNHRHGRHRPHRGGVRSPRVHRGAPPCRRARPRGPASVVVKAEGATAEATDVYEVTFSKSVALQLKFARGNDGGAYCVFVPDETEFDAFEIGDKILAVSASFGDDVWDADSYGQVIYAIKNRNGDIYLKMKKMNGDISALEQSEKSSAMKAERAGGNYGEGTKEDAEAELLQEEGARGSATRHVRRGHRALATRRTTTTP